MGSSSSTQIPDIPHDGFMCLSVCNFSSLMLLYAGKEEIEVVRDAIQFSKIKKIKEGYLENHGNEIPICYTFELASSPFKTKKDLTKPARTRILVSKIFQDFLRLGWKLLTCTDLSRAFDQTTLIFQKSSLVQIDLKVFNIGFSTEELMHVSFLDYDVGLYQTILDYCADRWRAGVEKDIKQYVLRHGQLDTLSIKFNSILCGEGSLYGEVSDFVPDLVEMLCHKGLVPFANCGLNENTDELFFYENNSFGSDCTMGMSLKCFDIIRLHKANEDVKVGLATVIQKHWPHGIENVTDGSYYEVQLSGQPWCSEGSDAVRARYLLLKIMEYLTTAGYFITSAFDLSSQQPTKSLLMLFNKSSPSKRKFLCIAPSKSSDLRFINAPEDVIEKLKTVLNHPAYQVNSEECSPIVNKIQYSLKLWHSIENGQGLYGRLLIMHLIITLHKLNYRLVCSMNATSSFYYKHTTAYLNDVHSLYFMYDETFQIDSSVNPTISESNNTLYPISHNSACDFTEVVATPNERPVTVNSEENDAIPTNRLDPLASRRNEYLEVNNMPLIQAASLIIPATTQTLDNNQEVIIVSEKEDMESPPAYDSFMSPPPSYQECTEHLMYL